MASKSDPKRPLEGTLIYSVLDHPRDFRLMRIKLDNIENLEVLLESYRLDSAPNFVAISYVWSDPKGQSSLICNGIDIQVSLNLWNLLSLLRRQGHSGFIWADAVCINQADNAEKVSRSGTVSIPTEVLIWCANAIGALGAIGVFLHYIPDMRAAK